METRLPPPLIDGLALLSIVLLWKFAPELKVGIPLPIALVIAVLLSFFGVFFAVAAIGLFKRKKTTVLPFKPEKTSALVTDGIFKVSRNPMYLGMSAVILAAAFAARQPLGLIPLFAAVAYLTKFQIIPEELALENKFGDEYVQYKMRVRRWI